MEFVLPEWVPQFGWAGIALAAVLAVLRGWLLPARTVDALREDYARNLDAVRSDRDERVAEVTAISNTWRDAYDTEREARLIHLQAVDQTLDTVETILGIIQAWDIALPRILNGDEEVERV